MLTFTRYLILIVFTAFLILYTSVLSWIIANSGGNVDLSHQGQTADAVMVLGSQVFVFGRPNRCLNERVITATSLVQNGQAPLLLVAGGTDPQNGSNGASYMANQAIKNGLPPHLIIKEPLSNNTFENFLFSRPLLERYGVKRLIVVTDAHHLGRATLFAEQLLPDVKVYVMPSQNTQCWRANLPTLLGIASEPFAVIHNVVVGKLNVMPTR